MKSIQECLDKLGIESLTAMQKATVDAVINGKDDLVVLSPTGSGKTYAYLLPLCQLLNADSEQVQCIVIVPGRELALQSSNVLKDMGMGIRSMACYGGRPTMDEHRMLRQVKPQVIFATPGRMNDHLDKGNIDTSGVRWLVIDEFDKCLALGFQDEMKTFMDRMPRSARRILLSATDAESIPSFVNLAHTQRIDFLDEHTVPERVRLYRVMSPEKDKLQTLYQLLCSLGSESSIVFVNYRESVERVASFLSDRGFKLSAFHGGLDQKQREDALYSFANGSRNILVSTDLASRGLDIPEIANIIHYHLPETESSYVHRVGRTARWERQGRAFFILAPDETVPSYVEEPVADYELPDELPSPALPKMATLYIGKGKKDKLSKGDVVGFLCKKGGLQGNEIGRIDVRDYYTYVAVERRKMLQIIRNVQGEKIKGIKTIVEEVK